MPSASLNSLTGTPPQTQALATELDNHEAHDPCGIPSVKIAQKKKKLRCDYGGAGVLCDFHDHSRLFLESYVRQLLDWYSITPVAVAENDIQSLARHVERFIHTTCQYYAGQGTIPGPGNVYINTFNSLSETASTSQSNNTNFIGTSAQRCETDEILVKGATNIAQSQGLGPGYPHGSLSSENVVQSWMRLEDNSLAGTVLQVQQARDCYSGSCT
ncbi:hypothetical protein F4802DRAFT_592258 [Xylaria palmicola]|nr:hypothetical protein F4802DRAFT_592258 [Xylaria palmicola]